MKPSVFIYRRLDSPKTIPALYYLLIIAFIAAMMAASFHSGDIVFLFPMVGFSLFLILGIASKKLRHLRKRFYSDKLATA